MKEASTAPVDMRPRKNSSAAEQFAEQRHLVSMVASCYKSCKEAPPIAAFNMAPTPGSGSHKWSPQTAEFICDVELAIRRSLELRSDKDSLLDAWIRFLANDTKIDDTQRRLIQIIGRSFRRRELHPGVYFRQNRYSHRRSAAL